VDIAGKTQVVAVIFMVASYIGLGVIGFTIGHPNYEYLATLLRRSRSAFVGNSSI
jgi:hypothetical protein